MTSQWIIDRRISGQPGLMAIVISGPGPHMQMDNEALLKTVEDELAECYPHWPKPEETMIIREKRATFSSRTGVNALRPKNKTNISGLWLTGDYTKIAYPATLESAVISGLTVIFRSHPAHHGGPGAHWKEKMDRRRWVKKRHRDSSLRCFPHTKWPRPFPHHPQGTHGKNGFHGRKTLHRVWNPGHFNTWGIWVPGRWILIRR